MLRLTGLTKSQLREWCSVRNVIPADILPDGPGRHALFSWQSAPALRLLKSIHEDWAGEVASWAEPIRTFRAAIERTAFPSLPRPGGASRRRAPRCSVQFSLSLVLKAIRMPIIGGFCSIHGAIVGALMVHGVEFRLCRRIKSAQLVGPQGPQAQTLFFERPFFSGKLGCVQASA